MSARPHPPLRLEGSITIDNVDDVKRQVDCWMVQITDLLIDASQVTQIDTAGFQLLLACARRSMEFGGAFECINPSEALLGNMRQLGFAADFSARSMAAGSGRECN